MGKHLWQKCPFSGMTENLYRVKPVSELADDADDMQVAYTEWVWGLKRGQLPYHIATAHNSLYLRKDIADLVASYQIILAPTFRMVKEIMDFLDHSRILRRNEHDKSPRRPLTALKPPSGLYRYVFIPFTDAARELQKEFTLQRQTADDLTGWVNPILGPGFSRGCDAFPIVECYAHPYYVCTLAEQALEHRRLGTMVTAQYATAASQVVELWKMTTTRARIPQWFIDSPSMEDDDITIASSQASGYTITSRGNVQDDRDEVFYEGDDVLHARVYEWAQAVDPEFIPEEQLPIPSVAIEVRRSERIRRRYNPYGKPEPVYRQDPIREAPWPTPEGADPYKYPPMWTERSSRFPTRRFSSNDWAFFCYNIALALAEKS